MAVASLSGMLLDILGGLYLAYDLLGGERAAAAFGLFGVSLLLRGVALQSVHYWAALFGP